MERKIMKRHLLTTALAVMTFTLAGCAASAPTYEVVATYSYADIAAWDLMVTPGGDVDKGSVVETNTTDGFVTIKAGPNNWGGVQSPSIKLDLEREPLIMVRIFENPDGSKWGAQVIRAQDSGEEWANYLIPDLNTKWSLFVAANVTEQLDGVYDEYGSEIDLIFWIYPTGANGTVSIQEVVIVYTK
jgi:hypothetical protein